MEKTRTIVFVGGDERSVEAAKRFPANGDRVFLLGFEKYVGNVGSLARSRQPERVLPEADVAVLPLPYTRDGETVYAPYAEQPILLETVFACGSSALVCGGMLPEAERRRDYCDEVLALENADITAEAALILGGDTLRRTLRGCRVLILGYGRIGKALTRKAAGVGSRVTVAARRESDRALIRLAGFEAADSADTESLMRDAELIYNTVPTGLFSPAAAEALTPGVPVIDLTGSCEGGRVLSARGLPGRYAPETAGAVLADAVRRLLAKEESV